MLWSADAQNHVLAAKQLCPDVNRTTYQSRASDSMLIDYEQLNKTEKTSIQYLWADLLARCADHRCGLTNA